MIIKAFIVAYNESDIIRFTIGHYQRFCQEVHLFDNYSTDNTPEIALEMGCHVHTYGVPGVFDDGHNLEVKNNAWKGHADADYVVVCDTDEILYGIGPNLHLPVYKSVGYDMFSETMPDRSWDEIAMGFRAKQYDKILLFSPKLVKEINFTYGCHSATPAFKKRTPGIAVAPILRHMRYVGGVEKLISRYRHFSERLSTFNRKHNLGCHYAASHEQIRSTWEYASRTSVEIGQRISGC